MTTIKLEEIKKQKHPTLVYYILLYDCLSYVNWIGQLEGNILRIALSLLPVPIVTQKSIIAIPWVGQYRKISVLYLGYAIIYIVSIYI